MEFRARPLDYAEQVEATQTCATYLRSVVDANQVTLAARHDAARPDPIGAGIAALAPESTAAGSAR